jgi:hypothetical protein
MVGVRAVCLIFILICAGVVVSEPTTLGAQADDGHPRTTLETLESLVGWHRPDPDMRTDIRVMTRSTLGVLPLPLVRLTGDANDHIVATVTEWGAPDSRPDGRPLFFKYLPLECSDDRSLCAGTPKVIRTPDVKALWFALLIARSCNDRPRKTPTDAEDLFVRGHVADMSMEFSCHAPNPRGPSPGDREAASILRISHRLLGR